MTNKNKTRGDFPVSWIAIVIAFAVLGWIPLFWPIGIYMVFRKLGAKKFGAPLRMLALIVGWICILCGATYIVNGLRNFIYWSYSLYDIYYGLLMLLTGLLVLLARRASIDRDNRYKKYTAVIGTRYYMAISEISAAMMLPAKKVKRDLMRMIERGTFGETAFIDEQGQYFLRSTYAYSVLQKERGQAQPEPEQKQEEPATEPEPTDEYQKILRQIRKVNDSIVDGPVSAKIDQIEDITARIFKYVSERPEKEDQIRSFMNYYLPTTLKLLNAYSQLERHGSAGENITTAKENIQDIMDRLITGFEGQLDQLYHEDVLDITSDIQVLEHMMQKDGFIPSDSPMQAEIAQAEAEKLEEQA